MENNTWIKLYRKIKNKGWYQKSQYVHLWVHILIKSDHEEKEFMWNGEMMKTKRGQFVTGRNALFKETSIPKTTIERILDFFEKDGQIGQQKNNKFRLITVNNYGEYQKVGHLTDIKRTSNGHLTDTYKEHKELKEQKDICRFAPPTPKEVSDYCNERNNGVDPDKWVNFYEAKGWMIGKNKMKDWKAAVRTWEDKKEKTEMQWLEEKMAKQNS